MEKLAYMECRSPAAPPRRGKYYHHCCAVLVHKETCAACADEKVWDESERKRSKKQ